MASTRAPRALTWSAGFVGAVTALVAAFGGLAVALTVWWAISPAPPSEQVWLQPATEDRSRAVLDALGVGGRADMSAVAHVAVERSAPVRLLPRVAGPVLVTLVWLGCSLGGLLLYRVLDSAVKGAPFAAVNVRRLRRLAWISVGGAVVGYVGPLLVLSRPPDDLPDDVLTLSTVPLLYWVAPLMVAAVLAALAAVFERGVQLAESDAATI